MATYTWPATAAFYPESFSLRPIDNDREFQSAFSGAVQTTSVPGVRWGVSITFGPGKNSERPALEAFLAKARREHRIALWNLKRPVPNGTINLSGVALQAAAGQFASSVVLTGCGAGKTLKAGDMLGLPNQLLMVADEAIADGAGAMTVNLTHPLRYAQSAGAAVTLNKPSALFIQKSGVPSFPAMEGYYPGFTLELVEVFA